VAAEAALDRFNRSAASTAAADSDGTQHEDDDGQQNQVDSPIRAASLNQKLPLSLKLSSKRRGCFPKSKNRFPRITSFEIIDID
jgi:hypothetical protein